MIVFLRGAEHGAVLQGAEDGVEPFVGLERNVLCVLVADGAQPTPHFTDMNEGTTQPAGRLGAGSHARTL